MVNKFDFAGSMVLAIGTWLVVLPASAWLINNFPISNQIILGVLVATIGAYIKTRGKR